TLILCGFILFGQPFIGFWAGESYIQAYNIVLIIMIPLTIPLIQNVGISILYAKNLQAFRSIILVLIAVVNIILSIPITKNYGAIGVAYITAFTLFIRNILIMNIYYRLKIGLQIEKFWRSILNISIPVSGVLVIGFLLNYFIPYNTISYLIFKIVLYSILHCSVLYFFVLNSYERDLIRNTLNRCMRKFY